MATKRRKKAKKKKAGKSTRQAIRRKERAAANGKPAGPKLIRLMTELEAARFGEAEAKVTAAQQMTLTAKLAAVMAEKNLSEVTASIVGPLACGIGRNTKTDELGIYEASAELKQAVKQAEKKVG